MTQRYLYVDANGNLQGPLWLSQIRELYALGKLSSSTEICIQGEAWSMIHAFPEITSNEEELLQQQAATESPKQAATYERRMWYWLALLLGLYVVYVIRSWK